MLDHSVTQLPLQFENEIWRPVARYEQIYDISDLGGIKRMKKGPGTFVGSIVKPVLHHSGYMMVSLSKNGVEKSYNVHNLVAEAFLGPCPEGKQINHKNGDKTDNRVENLEYITQSENTLHAYNTLGVEAVRGSACPWAKLTESQVLEIRRLYAHGVTQASLSRMFSLTPVHIHFIVKRKSWKHI